MATQPWSWAGAAWAVLQARPERDTRLTRTTNRTFLLAYLFTANVRQAERAVLQGLDEWDPEDGGTPVLSVLEAAARRSVRASCMTFHDEHIPLPKLPAELLKVLRLAPPFRWLFVLRVLAGVSLSECARLLDLPVPIAEAHLCSALRLLAVS